MKIIHHTALIEQGSFSASSEWKQIHCQILEAIDAVHWPGGTKQFILFDQPGKERGKGNGVKPIKDACMHHLADRLHWELETAFSLSTARRPGKFDASCQTSAKRFVLEWETGNVSSSHRALNKMCLGMLNGSLSGGALIVPTRKMYHYLTDRVGNYEELEPYFPVWRALGISDGLLAIFAIEQDGISKDVPRIPKGTDGRALR